MRIFLVGEGRHDIGDLAIASPYRQSKPGFLQPVIEKIVGPRAIFDGQKVSVLGKKPVRGLRGALERKAWMASLLAENAESDLLVFVTDLDRVSGTRRGDAAKDIKRKSELINRGCQSLLGKVECVPGIPCRTIEAWALGDRAAVASLIGADEPVQLPGGRSPEVLWGKPRDPNSDHPKMVLKRILGQMGTQEDLSQIAERADIRAMRQACPLSFEPFVTELEAATSRLRSA
jgi:Domain of unknown function (DUF4276)